MNALIKEFVDKYAPSEDQAGKFHEDLMDLVTVINSQAFLNSLQSGNCGRSLVSEADTVLAKLDTLLERSMAPAPHPVPQASPGTLAPTRTSSADTPFGSKQAKELAESKNVPVETIVPTGKTGKITKGDVQRAIKAMKPVCDGINVNGTSCSVSAESQCTQSGKWFCKKHQQSVELVRNVSSDDQPEHYGVSRTPGHIRSTETFSPDDAALNALTQIAEEALEDDSDDDLSSDRVPAVSISDPPAPSPAPDAEVAEEPSAEDQAETGVEDKIETLDAIEEEGLESDSEPESDSEDEDEVDPEDEVDLPPGSDDEEEDEEEENEE